MSFGDLSRDGLAAAVLNTEGQRDLVCGFEAHGSRHSLFAGIAQSVERRPCKADVAGSSPCYRHQFRCFGGVAQLGERLFCKQDVVGSIPSTSTNFGATRRFRPVAQSTPRTRSRSAIRQGRGRAVHAQPSRHQILAPFPRRYAQAGNLFRGVAQSGSAPALGAGCRRFKSFYPDQFLRGDCDA